MKQYFLLIMSLIAFSFSAQAQLDTIGFIPQGDNGVDGTLSQLKAFYFKGTVAPDLTAKAYADFDPQCSGPIGKDMLRAYFTELNAASGYSYFGKDSITDSRLSTIYDEYLFDIPADPKHTLVMTSIVTDGKACWLSEVLMERHPYKDEKVGAIKIQTDEGIVAMPVFSRRCGNVCIIEFPDLNGTKLLKNSEPLTKKDEKEKGKGDDSDFTVTTDGKEIHLHINVTQSMDNSGNSVNQNTAGSNGGASNERKGGYYYYGNRNGEYDYYYGESVNVPQTNQRILLNKRGKPYGHGLAVASEVRQWADMIWRNSNGSAYVKRFGDWVRSQGHAYGCMCSQCSGGGGGGGNNCGFTCADGSVPQGSECYCPYSGYAEKRSGNYSGNYSGSAQKQGGGYHYGNNSGFGRFQNQGQTFNNYRTTGNYGYGYKQGGSNAVFR